MFLLFKYEIGKAVWEGPGVHENCDHNDTHLITMPTSFSGMSIQTPMKSWMFSCRILHRVRTSETKDLTSSDFSSDLW